MDEVPPVGGPITYIRPDGTRGIVSIDLGTPVIDPGAPPKIPPYAATPRGVATPVGSPYRPRAAQPSRPAGPDPDFDNPVIGGKLTVFTLLFGNFPDMHRRCLGSLVSTLADEPGRSELRVISNALGDESRRYVRSLVDRGSIDVWTEYPDNRLKYVAMRAAFHNPNRPITTPYLIWADDDTMFDVDRGWLRILARQIRDRHADGCRLYGPPCFFNLHPNQIPWYRSSPTYRGIPFQDRAGGDSPNGSGIHFASGGFWALHTDTMRAADIPDARLRHNGGDVWIGWAVRQAGGKLCPFASGKTTVRWSAFKRRGFSEPHPGLN